MRFLGAIAMIGLGGCAAKLDDGPTQREFPKAIAVVGDPADFKTRPGQSDGYDVVECWDHSCAGVVGTGQSWAPGMQQGPGTSPPTYDASFQRFRADLTTELASTVRSIDTSGVSRRCGVGFAETVFWLHSWRDLDPALIAAGRFLKTRDLKERISFCVQAHAAPVDESSRARQSEDRGPRGQFRGFMRLGPEQVSFQACGTPRAGRWWWELEPKAAGEEVPGWVRAREILDAQPRCDLDTLPCDLQEVYVELDGRLAELGHFGHLGGYGRKLTVTRVLYASRAAATGCTQP